MVLRARAKQQVHCAKRRRFAPEHLLERGLRRLAYYGVKGFSFSELRCRGFTECAEQAG